MSFDFCFILDFGGVNIFFFYFRLQEADLGFHLIVDRRKDRWNSVKAVLLKISGYFPGIVHVVYVLRPSGFFQKAISEVNLKNYLIEMIAGALFNS